MLMIDNAVQISSKAKEHFGYQHKFVENLAKSAQTPKQDAQYSCRSRDGALHYANASEAH